ncbi:MAG: transglycosylase SLT domain-containing protein [Chitinophagales bacterium]|nr:transglycosylase SLT domain-containing protein [Chitinophagales bacterium]
MNKKYYVALIVSVLIFLMIATYFFYLKSFPFASNFNGKSTLVMVTAYNPTGYFLYRDQEMGFEYDLLKKFSDTNNKKLKVIVVQDEKEMFQKLISHQADIMAYYVPVMNLPIQEVTFSQPYTQSEWVLVQRKSKSEDTYNIDKVSDLSGKTLVVSEQSSSIQALNEINFGLKTPINIQSLDSNVSTEDLIRLVAKSEIDYTIAPKEIALINSDYFDNIDISCALTAPQEIAFVLNKENKNLLSKLNQFISQSKEDESIYELYDRYFKTERVTNTNGTSADVLNTANISIYDFWIQKYSRNILWDWRLVAAMIWQESRFKSDAKSWAGATGLMQLMPATARRFGLNTMQEIYHPELNIKTGTKYIKWLEDFWSDIKDDSERKKFIIASYNAGEGHVRDAQALARKYGKNPQKWDNNVDYFLLNKSNPYYYLDPVCKYGYCRGSEPYFYVRNIVRKYEQYKQHYSSDHLAILDLSISFPPLPENYFSPVFSPNQELFKKNDLFKENKIFETDSNNANHLKPRNPERIKLRTSPPEHQLFRRNELFKKK